MNAKGIKRTPEGVKHFKQLRAIFRSLGAGASIHQACKLAGVNVTTFWRWRQRRGNLDRLVNKTIESRIQMVEDAQYNAAIKGNATAQIFYLTNRCPGRWKRDAAQVRVGVHVEQNNYAPVKGLKDEELDGIINRFTKQG